MDGEEMILDDCSFDVVYCHTVLHFTPDLMAIIEKIHRELKLGGQAILKTINRHSMVVFFTPSDQFEN